MLSFFKKLKKPKIWLISDGSDAITQSEELAKCMTSQNNIHHFDRLTAHSFTGKYPDYAIGARQGVADTLLGIKQRSGGKTKIIQILDPQKKHDQFDWLILPSYEPYDLNGNIIFTIGIINYINENILSESKLQLKKSQKYEYLRKKGLKPPFLTILIGGKHIGGELTPEDGRELARKANFILERKGGTALVTTSKRTELETIKAFREEIKVPHFIYDYKIREYENPYDIFITLADEIIVTGDSVRMMSEACSAGKKVRIYTPQKVGFQYVPLIKELIEANYAIDFNIEQTEYENEKLNEANRVAKIILEEDK